MNVAVNPLQPSHLIEQNTCLPHQTELRAFQVKALEEFIQRGFPTRKEERWKYTDVSHIAKKFRDHQFLMGKKGRPQIPLLKAAFDEIHFVFVDGSFSADLSALDHLPTNVVLLPLSEALQTHEQLLQSYITKQYDVQKHPFAGLNSGLMTDGIFLSIPAHTEIKTPIRCTFITTQNNLLTSPRNIILLGPNSQVTMIEEHKGEAEHYFTNTVTHIFAEAQAKINYFKVQMESQQAVHCANLFIDQKQESQVNHFSLSLGAHLSRDDIHVAVSEKHAACQLHGLYELNHDGQHTDHHLHVDHTAALGSSTMVYKGVLNKKSRAVFNGKVFVHPDAQQIQAHQENHNLLLSNDAEIDTKPELEIYADDVKCTHGATVGQLDTESLFYLRSRGIEKEHAMEILRQAFAAEMFEVIENPAIKFYLRQQVGCHE